MNKNVILLLGALLLMFTSCEKEEKQTNIEIKNPATYKFERNGQSTVSYGGQTARIGMATELIGAMKNSDATLSQLLEMYSNKTASGGDANPYANADLNASTKSVKSKVAASKEFFSSNTATSAQIKADFEKWLKNQVEVVAVNRDNLAEAGKAGQIADGSKVRYVNTKGQENDQLVAKGLIGALMTDQILNNYLSTQVLDESDNKAKNDAGTVADGKPYTTMEHKWDEAYGYLFGASSDGANPLAEGGADSFLNKYLFKVNGDDDFAGIASKIWEAFKLGRAAIVAHDYKVRDEQIAILRKEISKVVAVRATHYLQGGKKALEAGDMGGAFHDLSEGYGFVYSLQFLHNPDSGQPYFSKSEVDGFIAKLEAGNGFWDLKSSTLDDLSKAIADKFDFTVAQTI